MCPEIMIEKLQSCKDNNSKSRSILAAFTFVVINLNVDIIQKVIMDRWIDDK